ncbi:hypothetical protein [uncultured Jannaschia sp.]|uniref:hypothetical protein n=1 Tax=Jannaschia halovivens TaxID=3388667 RepID=UPI002627C24F|nr:hypothetical protein [uncultured Jannaschia sp.]
MQELNGYTIHSTDVMRGAVRQPATGYAAEQALFSEMKMRLQRRKRLRRWFAVGRALRLV